MCFSPRRISSATPRPYDVARDGARTQENAILYALRQTNDGRSVERLRDIVRDVQGRIDYVPVPSVRRAVAGLRNRGYDITVSDGLYRLRTV